MAHQDRDNFQSRYHMIPAGKSPSLYTSDDDEGHVRYLFPRIFIHRIRSNLKLSR